MSAEKILVVDDDLNICELLRLYLTKDGYNVNAYQVITDQDALDASDHSPVFADIEI